VRSPLWSCSRALVQHALPPAALLSATCAALFVLAAAVALLAWWRPVPRAAVHLLDASGVLTLIGVWPAPWSSRARWCACSATNASARSASSTFPP
jgi:hypothetical protein